MVINLGVTFNVAKSKVCVKCGGKGWERHHIIYFPEEIAILCNKCHKRITKLNRAASRKVPIGQPYRPLNNKHRKRIWRRYLDG